RDGGARSLRQAVSDLWSAGAEDRVRRERDQLLRALSDRWEAARRPRAVASAPRRLAPYRRRPRAASEPPMSPTAALGVAFSRGLAPNEVIECVRLAEELGYESAWMAEGHAGDQFSILGACAAVTTRITLGTSISSVFVRSAPTIAMAAATVDDLSGGRFILGLGTSHREQVEPEHGIPFTHPTDRLRDTVDIVRALL